MASLPLALFVGAAALSRSPVAFRVLVREDGVLEWLQVAGYATAAGAALILARRLAPRRRLAAAAAGLALLLVVVVGEELSWGERLLGLEVDALQAVNDQGDLTVHNIGPALTVAQVAFFVLAGAGAACCALPSWPRLARRLPTLAGLAPGVAHLPWFAAAAAYTAVRLVALPAPGYEVAKLAEVAELCLAAAAASALLSAARRAPALVAVAGQRLPDLVEGGRAGRTGRGGVDPAGEAHADAGLEGVDAVDHEAR